MKFKIFIINVLLMCVAGFLLLTLSTIGIITALCAIIFKGASTNYFRDVALSLDIAGNVVCSYLFNILFFKKESKNLCGLVEETISSVLGKNEQTNTLTKLGKIIADILNWIDPQHCYKSIKWEVI